jgi:hypothetical protein
LVAAVGVFFVTVAVLWKTQQDHNAYNEIKKEQIALAQELETVYGIPVLHNFRGVAGPGTSYSQIVVIVAAAAAIIFCLAMIFAFCRLNCA